MRRGNCALLIYVIPFYHIRQSHFVGCAMTYTLFEFAKENTEELTARQPDAPVQVRYYLPVDYYFFISDIIYFTKLMKKQ